MSSPAVAVPDVPMMVRIERAVPVIELPEHLGFDALRDWVRENLPAHADVIGGRSSRLDLGGREIKLFDLRRLIHVLREEFGVDVTGIYIEREALHRYAERELKLKLFLHDEAEPEESAAVESVDGSDASAETLSADATTEVLSEVEAITSDTPIHSADEGLPDADLLAKATLPHDLDADTEDASGRSTPSGAPRLLGREEPQGSRTMSVHRTLRSGASVRFDGDVVLYGDVNPGAHVVATGNIVVLGALKGMAHAGAGGDEDAFIMALTLRPTQLRIARKIAVPPERDVGVLPERARVEGDQIVIEPFASRARG